MTDELPIQQVIPELLAALRSSNGAVLIAPPGAGKTTAVAPALLSEDWCSGQVIVTSPRRVAARTAAERMAELLGEKAGHTVGYATRLDTKQSSATRILVVSEAILVNRLIDDPELAGVSAILFDEAHERHLDTDLALALALESRAVLRSDLRLLIMSATIDGKRFVDLLGDAAPLVTSEGRAHSLSIRWLGSAPGMRIEDAVTSAVLQAWRDDAGDMLVFLPGTREIARVEERLTERLLNVPVLPLHGQVTPGAQRAAIRRDPDGRRRIVLATSLAETSLTLDGVSIVVDSGLARQPVFDRVAGTTHLVTVRASQAAAAQRAGRAARQGPGVVYRLWEEAGHAGRPPFDPPEILTANLSPMLLSLANWGTTDPASLAWLDQPPVAAVAAARASLEKLGAFDEQGRITSRGRQMAALPLDPQSAAMVLFGAAYGAARRAAQLVLLLQERGLGGRDTALEARLAKWDVDRSPRAEASRHLTARWAKQAEQLVGSAAVPAIEVPLGVILAAGRPEFVAKRRTSSGDRWLSAGGRGFILDPADPLAKEPFLAIGDAQGQAQGARITAAASLDEEALHQWSADRIQQRAVLNWTGYRVEPRLERRLDAILLSSATDSAPDETAIANLLVEKAVDNFEEYLPDELMARALFTRLSGMEVSHLKATADAWLVPLLQRQRDLSLLKSKMEPSLIGLLSWSERQQLNERAPTVFVSPAGTHHPISYGGPDAPFVEVRVQAMFGLDRHPMIGVAPLLLKLTNPAGRPIQATRDLPGFWRGSWADVRKEMKGRYPKHRWPEQPWLEAASLKTKNAFAAGQS